MTGIDNSSASATRASKPFSSRPIVSVTINGWVASSSILATRSISASGARARLGAGALRNLSGRAHSCSMVSIGMLR